MTSQAFLPPPPVAARPVDEVKGAWGGAWLVVYGCVGVLKGLFTLGAIELLVRLAALGSMAVRTKGVEAADDTPLRMAKVLDAAPDALGKPLAPWIWVGVGLSAAALVAGMGVLRRSDVARRAALALLVASVALAVAMVVAWGVQVLPKYEAWMGEFREFVREAERMSGNTSGLADIMQTSGWQQLATEIAMQIVHLGIVALLVVRLAGASTRAWCARGPVASPGRPR
jgi:hypothetical protein